MSDYDIGKAFEEIENELIDSMMHNFSRHRAEETKEGYNWTQWQAEQLKALEEYRKTNAKKFGKQFKSINSKVEEMIHTARANGNAEQEVKILEAIKNGFTPHMPTGASTGEFFKVNNRKLNALVKSTTDDLKRAETAVLRMSNDKYRKAIFNAQVYANTGAGTYEKAVDMACKDMLNAGLNCVEYKNGARHTLSDYADMAIKTANKRAYLRGEGEERAKYGLSLVVVNSRQGGCPDCAKYIGRVFIDDVYSNGKKSDGDYPLLSTAIAEGLFHPRCKDSTSTYYPELDDLGGPLSDDELAELDRQRGLEVQQQHAEKQAERFDRRAKYSLDEDNKKFAKARADEWHDRADRLEEQNKNSVHKISDTQEQKLLTDTEIEKSDSSTENTNRSVENSENNDIIEFEKGVTQAVQENFTDEFEKMQDKFGKITTISRVGVLNSKTSSDYGAFYDNSGELLLRFANKKNALSKHAQKAQEMKKSGEWSSAHSLHTFRHEIGHAIQLEHRLNDPLWDDKLEQISKIMDGLNEPIDIDIKKYSVSRYSMTNIDDFISECIAESMTKKSRATAKEVVNIIIGVD